MFLAGLHGRKCFFLSGLKRCLVSGPSGRTDPLKTTSVWSVIPCSFCTISWDDITHIIAGIWIICINCSFLKKQFWESQFQIFNPYWEISENSSRKFFEISVFRGVKKTDFWKTNPLMFCEYLFSFCKISGHELDRFLENSSYLDKFSRNRSVSVPEFVKSHFST